MAKNRSRDNTGLTYSGSIALVNTSQINTIKKYLQKHVEPEALHFDTLNIGIFNNCLVIPAYQEEYPSLKKVWQKLGKNVLIILVVNSPKAGDTKTQDLINDLLIDSHTRRVNKNLSFLVNTEERSILLVDRCSIPIPSKQGVGLARKIGADIALSLIMNKQIKSPWIFCTDADVSLPSSYFDADKDIDKACSAFIYPFQHRATEDHQYACQLYESSLLYYVVGLRFASSTYAYPTIGSTIAISAYSYSAVRGFPCRSAGEDFYLLNKLAKVGNIQQLKAPIIVISGRLSERVPFGTGVGIKRILDTPDSEVELLFYNPIAFLALKKLLEKLRTCQEIINLKEYFSQDSHFGPILIHWAESTGIFEIIKSKQSQRAQVFDKFIHDWMDAFRTLKFIHFVRDLHFPSLPWQALLDGSVLQKKDPNLRQIELKHFYSILEKAYKQP